MQVEQHLFITQNAYAYCVEEESKMVRGFEAAKMRTIYPVRLVSLTVKLYRRIYHNVGAKMHTVHVWSQHTFDLVRSGAMHV